MNKRRNQIIIGTSYFLSSFNCIIVWLVSVFSETGNDSSIIILGIVMAIMIPISLFDPREQMQNNAAAFYSIILHFIFNFLITIMFSPWLLFLFIPESLFLILLFILHRM